MKGNSVGACKHAPYSLYVASRNVAPTYTRRRLLSGAAAVTAMAGLAGCAGQERDGEGAGEEVYDPDEDLETDDVRDGEGAGERVYDPEVEPDETPTEDVTDDPWEANRTADDDSS